ncbi:MAG: molybdopterin molybdenumtransferase MoeA [Desulfocapsa sp.]|nr:MAG: molybdopterin molybdenumtransferase MoeA [Desulfocapsa sp.]
MQGYCIMLHTVTDLEQNIIFSRESINSQSIFVFDQHPIFKPSWYNVKGFFQLISSREFLDLFQRFSPLNEETLPLGQTAGRILARDVRAPEQLPPFSRSTMDGFAVRARDTFGCSESEPALLTITGEIAMGSSGRDISLLPGKTARIWTGGELADTADAVVMVEYTHVIDHDTIEIFRPVAPGENVIRAGEDTEKGQVILTRGRKLRPQDLGVLAGLGITTVSVYCRPVVAVLSTGDELVAPDQKPGPGRIRDINSTTLAALVAETGCVARQYGIFPDKLDTMFAACRDALAEADMVLLSGGSSVGRRDFTLQVLKRLENSELLAHGVAIRPGKPTILAAQGNKAIFGLPGHVASAMVVFYLFVRPLLHRFSGMTTDLGLLPVQAVTGEQIPSAIGREEYVRVQLIREDNDSLPVALPIYGKSGLLTPLVRADGLLVIARDSEGLDKGTTARVLLFPACQ